MNFQEFYFHWVVVLKCRYKILWIPCISNEKFSQEYFGLDTIYMAFSNTELFEHHINATD